MAWAEPDFQFLLHIALGNIEEGILLIDGDDRMQLWNDAYLNLLDLPPTLFHQGAPVLPLIRILVERGDYGPGDPDALTAQVIANVRKRISASGERQRANGQIIAADWIVAPDNHLLFRLRDVTSERMTSRFKDEIIGTVSHELRTPLTVIAGALGLIRAGMAGTRLADAADLLEVAHKNCDRLTRLVNDLLDIDKLQSGNLDLVLERTDIAPLLEDAVRENGPYVAELNIALILERPDEPLFAAVDRGRLHQILANLISNAAKFSSPGSTVRLVLGRAPGMVRISVIDQGRGMSQEFSRRLFSRFAQESRYSESGKPGSGLGLAICKNIVDLHQGQIRVDTKEGVGTIVHIDLPDQPDER